MTSLADASDKESELLRFLWVLRNGKGFGLYFVCCNAPAYRRELVDKIKAEYAHPILEFDLSGHDGEEYIDHRLLTWAEDKTPGAPFFLYGLEILLPTRDEDRQFRTLQEINWRRNVYSQLNRNLIIWLPEYALTLLARTASDFYDWHSAVFEFPVPESEKAGFVKQSMMEFMDGETHPANRMTLAEKKRWLSVLNGLLDETPKDTAEYARLLNDLGRLYESMDDYKDAFLNYNYSLKIYRNLKDRIGEATALDNISQIYISQGDYNKALIMLEDALKIRRETQDKMGECATMNHISVIYYFLGEYNNALKYFECALEVLRDLGYRMGEGTVLNNISQIYYNQGNYAKSLSYLENALVLSCKIGDRVGEGKVLNNIARVYSTQGNDDKGLEYLKKALLIHKDIGDRKGLCASLFNLANIYAHQGNQLEAEHAWLEAYCIAKEIGHAEGLKALEKLANDLGKEGLAYWESQS